MTTNGGAVGWGCILIQIKQQNEENNIQQ